MAVGLLIGLAIALMGIGFFLGIFALGLLGAITALLLSLVVMGVDLYPALKFSLSSRQWRFILAFLGAIAASIGLFLLSPWNEALQAWYWQTDLERFGAIGGVVSAVAQLLIAILALIVTWEQYVTSKRLTIQQNTITQQQTIDSYFQGMAELTLDEQGLLEDFPMERAIAEGRTAAILSSVDAAGKAKVLRFLSRAGLLTPIKRDQRLGRPILDGSGGYAEDRVAGVRVIDLGVMLAGANLAKTDLRWTDLSDINLIRVNMHQCDLVRSNLARSILMEANLRGCDLFGARFFYGLPAKATPRTKTNFPNYETGEFTGAVIEGIDLTGAIRLSEEQRYYCCAWGGSKTRQTVPGGCEGIPNSLGR